MWGAFACPQCHKWLRVRRNYALRISRLAAITGALCLLLFEISDWFRLHLHVSIAAFAVVGVIDEYLLRLLPATLEPAAPGGLGVS